MRLLLATIPRFRRLLPSTEGLVTALFIAVLVGLELFGSFANTDLYDLLAGMVLALAIALLVDRHRRTPIPWLGWLTARVRSMNQQLRKLAFQLGIDLRGSPVLPARLPPIVWGIYLLLIGLIAVSLVVWNIFPGGWRDLGLKTVYTLYLTGIMALWSGLLLTTFGSMYLLVQVIEAILPQQWSKRDRRSLQAIILLASGMAISTIAMTIPVVFVLGGSLLLTLVGLIASLRTGRPEPALLWRRSNGYPIYSIPMWKATLGFYTFLTLTMLALLISACGGRLLTTPNVADPMIITEILGVFTAWMSPCLAIGILTLVWTQWREDPARERPLALKLSSHPESSYAENLNQAIRVLRGWGWQIEVIHHPRPSGFGLHLVPAELSEAREFDPHWPLKVSLEDLQDGEVKDRFVRRDEIRLRRQAMRGVSSLFKRAFAERQSRGGGYWFAPQWVFYSSLHRDPPDGDSKDEPGPVGSSYSSVFGPRVRHYLYQVLRAVQVDSIYVEDGIGQRTIVRVLRKLCDIYDRHGDKRRAEDHFFQDIPKVRVIMHDYSPGQRFEVSGYREPRFDELDRARVMHIFRDNGGEEAEIDSPFDISWEPSPSLQV